MFTKINDYLDTKKNLKGNIHVIDIERLINNYSLSDYLDTFVDIHHPSEKGHLLIANEIIKSIEKKDPNIKFFDICNNYIINKNGLSKKFYINKNMTKTGLAGILAASLELTKEGVVKILQKARFDRIMIKKI